MASIPYDKNRNLGLDIVRSTAILLVLLCHCMFSYVGFYNVKFMAYFGILGVEMFFVLSGFLIGKILINSIVYDPSWASLKSFWKRRWFRTLPLYYLMLMLYAVIYRLFYPEYLLFLQNFTGQVRSVFTISWSLTIEEWFYLLVPSILIPVLRISKNKSKSFIITCLIVLAVSLVSKIIYVISSDPHIDDIRTVVIFRLDGIMLGVLLAGLKMFNRPIYDAMSKHVKFNVLASLLLFITMGLIYTFILKSDSASGYQFVKVIFFPVISIASGFLILSVDQNPKINQDFAKNSFSHIFFYISSISYSIYLVHPFFFDLFNTGSTVIEKSLNLIPAWIFSFIVSHFLHQYFEIPIMNLRDNEYSQKKLLKARS